MNKTKVVLLFLYIISFFLGFFPIDDIYAQRKHPGVTLKTTKMGDKVYSPEPHPDSPRFKLSYESQDSIFITLYAKEFRGNLPVYNEFDRINFGRLNKGGKLFGEIIVDISKETNLILFFNFPGLVRYAYAGTTSDKIFKVAEFETVADNQGIDMLPVFLIYADDREERLYEKIVESYLKDGKIPVNKAQNDQLQEQIPMFILVYYEVRILNKT